MQFVAENRYQNARVIAHKVGVSPTANPKIPRNLTSEQKAQRQKETDASYEVWRREREARKAKRYDIRSRNNGF